MKKNLLFIIAIFAMCVTVFAQPTPMSITIAGTNRTIEVDGYPDDDLWIYVDPLSFDYSFQDPGPAESDVSAALQIAWSELGLLIFLDITDDVENYWTDGENTWEQDNAEFFFYFGEEGTWGADAEVTAVGGDSLFSQIRLQLNDDYETITDGRYKGNWAPPPFGSADTGAMQAMAVSSGFGWSVEAIMPWAMFSMTFPPEEGLKFGFDNNVGDADETIRDFQISLMNDSGEDLDYDNKAYLNTAELGAVTILSNIRDIFVNRVSVYPTIVNNVLNLTGEVNSVTIYNVTGQAILNVKDVNITTVDVSSLQPGIYFVNLNNETTQKVIIR